jgi:hypothetical protein
MLTSVYENEALFCMYIFKWFKIFRQAHEDIEDIQATGSHTVLKIQREVQNGHFREAKSQLPLLEIECQLV